ncbi:hypothetical protein RB2150_12416 [Rhodobacteraceae bacterium HTCC2150]|nr:hypothetical protein RB2150_12416 [Rhodobacteraceae bacterium HTCC2150]
MKTLLKFGLAGALIMLPSAAGPLIEITEPVLLAANDTTTDTEISKFSVDQNTTNVSRVSSSPALFLTPPSDTTSDFAAPANLQTAAMVVAPTIKHRTLIPMIMAAMPAEPAHGALPVAYTRPMSAQTPDVDSRQLLSDPNLSAFGLPCRQELTITVAPNDMMAIMFNAPCLNERSLTLAAGEMELSVTTDIFGNFATHLPQLTQETQVSIFDGANLLVSSNFTLDHTPVGEAYVLIWKDIAPMNLFVRSNDLVLRRDKGRLGLIENSRTPTGLTHFTAPEKFQSIRFSLVGTVDAENCGQVSKARLVHRGNVGIESTDLQFRMPDCDQIGKTLELRSVIPDMKMARN